jgi:hypothetical protein
MCLLDTAEKRISEIQSQSKDIKYAAWEDKEMENVKEKSKDMEDTMKRKRVRCAGAHM